MGWADLFTRGLDVVETPGDHWSLLKEPHLQVLARRIDQCIGKLRASPADESITIFDSSRTGISLGRDSGLLPPERVNRDADCLGKRTLQGVAKSRRDPLQAGSTRGR
jgi:hypothetical protein